MNKIIELSVFEKDLVCGGKNERQKLYVKRFECEDVSAVNGTIFECYDVRPAECKEAPLSFWRAGLDILTSLRIFLTVVISIGSAYWLESKIPYDPKYLYRFV